MYSLIVIYWFPGSNFIAALTKKRKSLFSKVTSMKVKPLEPPDLILYVLH